MSSRIRDWVLAVLALGLGVVGCRKDGPETATPEPEAEPEAVSAADKLGAFAGPPVRWVIDGTTLAEDPTLPLELDRALREFGRTSEEVQDHIIVDVNGDGQLDALVLLPAPAVAGAYDHLLLLSDGGTIRVHVIGDLVAGASFSAAVVPLTDGPTLIGIAPRMGGCERGPEWTFLRPTGGLLEPVGTLLVEGYDCAVAEASIEFERDADGRVAAVLLRHGDAITRYEWDASVGSFASVGD